MKNKSEVVIYLCGFTGRNGWNTCHWPWKRFNDVYNHLGYEVPYFIDGRKFTRNFYSSNLSYTTDIGDSKTL